MLSGSANPFRRWTLLLNGGFLFLVGIAAMFVDVAGYFWGTGPLAATLGSPQSIGGFEAHGLAAILGIFMFRSAEAPASAQWHAIGLSTHMLLGGANLLFWPSFVELNLVPVGVVTTIFHGVFAAAQAACLSRSYPALAPPKPA